MEREGLEVRGKSGARNVLNFSSHFLPEGIRATHRIIKYSKMHENLCRGLLSTEYPLQRGATPDVHTGKSQHELSKCPTSSSMPEPPLRASPGLEQRELPEQRRRRARRAVQRAERDGGPRELPGELLRLAVNLGAAALRKLRAEQIGK